MHEGEGSGAVVHEGHGASAAWNTDPGPRQARAEHPSFSQRISADQFNRLS